LKENNNLLSKLQKEVSKTIKEQNKIIEKEDNIPSDKILEDVE